MKKMKRLAAFLLAMVMMLAMAMPAMAATDPAPATPDPTKEKITISVPSGITNASEGKETYIAYKIFSATKSAAPSSGIAYFLSSDSPWAGIASDSSITPFLKFTKASDDSGWTVTWNEYDATNNANGKESNETSAKELASLLLAKITVDGTTHKIGDTTLTENTDYYSLTQGTEKQVDIGYYLITSSFGSNLILATTDINIAEKNDYPTVDKKIVTDATNGTEADVQIGDTVTFKLTATIPAEATKQVVLRDTMSEGLTLKLSETTFKVKNGDAEVAQKNGDKDNWTVTYSNSLATNGNNTQTGVDKDDSLTDGSFVVTFTEDYIKTLTADATLTVTYGAVLNNNAVLKNGENIASNDNKVKLEYSNFTTQEVTTKVYTYDFDLVKYSQAEDTKTLLAGAQFKLYKADQVGENGKLNASATNIKFVKSGNTYKVYDGIAESATPVDILDSVADSAMNIQGLDAGDYYLQEVKAPDGYNMLDTLVKVTVEATKDNTSNKINGNKVGSVTGTVNGDNVSYGDITTGNKTASISEGTNTYTSGGVGVLNQSGSVLPSTGGIGTTIFYIVGGILVVGAGVILVTRKRMER